MHKDVKIDMRREQFLKHLGGDDVEILTVKGTLHDVDVSYAYTAGLSEKQIPEIISIGLVPKPQLVEMIQYVVDSHYDEGSLDEGLVDCGMFIGDVPLRAYLRPVTDRDTVVNLYAKYTDDIYGKNAGWWQLLWADENNVLPTEPGYNSSLTQPVL